LNLRKIFVSACKRCELNAKEAYPKRQASFIVYGNKTLLNTEIDYKDKKLFLLKYTARLKIKNGLPIR